MKRDIYGESIHTKFNEDGSVRSYPGNTIICFVDPKRKEHAPIQQSIALVHQYGLAEKYIWLPPSSYHVTVMQGVNDQVRAPGYWSKYKELDTPLEEMDQFFQERLRHVPGFDRAELVIDSIQNDNMDLRIVLKPIDEQTDALLRAFRDDVSEQFGVRLPNHDTYRFHITLAYVWRRFNDEELKQLQPLLTEMNTYLKAIDKITITNPMLTFYDNMIDFPTERKRTTG